MYSRHKNKCLSQSNLIVGRWMETNALGMGVSLCPTSASANTHYCLEVDLASCWRDWKTRVRVSWHRPQRMVHISILHITESLGELQSLGSTEHIGYYRCHHTQQWDPQKGSLFRGKGATRSTYILIGRNPTIMQPNVLGTPTGIAFGELNQLEDKRMSFRGGNSLPSGNCLYIPR